VQQTVDEVPADLAEEGSVVYQIVLDEDGLDVHAGAPVTPTVTLRTSYRTAAAIAAGKESAQVAFMDGRLRVGGDIGALLARHEILAELDDVFAGVRARTKWPDRDHR
jgi:putative sterol carrier protein